MEQKLNDVKSKIKVIVIQLIIKTIMLIISTLLPLIIIIVVVAVISGGIVPILIAFVIGIFDSGSDSSNNQQLGVNYSNVSTLTADGRISYSGITISEEDKNNLGKIAQSERGDGTQQQREYVVSVVLNRALSSAFPNTIMGVITAPRQYEAYSNGSFDRQVPDETTINAVNNVIQNGDTTGGCLYFMTPAAAGSWITDDPKYTLMFNDGDGNPNKTHNFYRESPYSEELLSTATNNQSGNVINAQGNVTSSDPDFYANYASNISSPTILAIVNTALAQEGKNLRTLKSENSDVWIRGYEDWCADFVSFCFAKNGQLGKGKAIEEWQSAARYGFGKWITEEYGDRCSRGKYIPKPGDVLNAGGNNSHVALVYACDGNYVYYVEGNSGSVGELPSGDHYYNHSVVSITKRSLDSSYIKNYYPCSERIR